MNHRNDEDGDKWGQHDAWLWSCVEEWGKTYTKHVLYRNLRIAFFFFFFQGEADSQRARPSMSMGCVAFSRTTTQLHRHLTSRDHSNPCRQCHPPPSSTPAHGGKSPAIEFHRANCGWHAHPVSKNALPQLWVQHRFSSDNQGQMGAPYPAGLCNTCLFRAPAILVFISMRNFLFSKPRVCNVYSV